MRWRRKQSEDSSSGGNCASITKANSERRHQREAKPKILQEQEFQEPVMTIENAREERKSNKRWNRYSAPAGSETSSTSFLSGAGGVSPNKVVKGKSVREGQPYKASHTPSCFFRFSLQL